MSFIERIKRFLGIGSKPDESKDEKAEKEEAKKEAKVDSKKEAKKAEKVSEKAESSEPKKEKSSKQEDGKVADKPKIGYIHLSGCTGDGMSLTLTDCFHGLHYLFLDFVLNLQFIQRHFLLPCRLINKLFQFEDMITRQVQ